MKYEVRGADYDLIQSILINIEIVLSIIKNNKIPKKIDRKTRNWNWKNLTKNRKLEIKNYH